MRQLKVETIEEPGDDVPHLDLREVLADAVAGAVAKGLEDGLVVLLKSALVQRVLLRKPSLRLECIGLDPVLRETHRGPWAHRDLGLRRR